MMRKLCRSLPLLSLGALLWSATDARAETCTISASDVAFGIYDATLGTDLDSTGTISVTCTTVINKRVTYDIALSQGNAGSYSPRTMVFGTDLLNYNLYTKSNRNQIWGDGTGGTRTVSDSYNLGPPGTQTDTHTIYGRIPGGQTTPGPGFYVDNITATVTF